MRIVSNARLTNSAVEVVLSSESASWRAVARVEMCSLTLCSEDRKAAWEAIVEELDLASERDEGERGNAPSELLEGVM